MLTAALISIVMLLALTAINIILAVPFISRTMTKPGSAPEQRYYSKAAVILCLRGADPFLKKCINGLLNQDYPDYTLHIIVDHKADPANVVLKQLDLQNHAGKVQLHILQKPSEHCSLKCASQVQVIQSLDPSVRVIAFADADIIPHPQWLSGLVLPLSASDAGATTGNRWYLPGSRPHFGSVVRYVWNSAALVTMYWLRIPWGGSMAVKRDVFEKTDIIAHWTNAFCEDTSLNQYLEKLGLKFIFVPTLFMFNHEDCSLRSFISWEARQLINNRLHHPLWYLMVTHAFLLTGTLSTGIVLLIIACLSGSTLLSALLLSGTVLYMGALLILLGIMEYHMDRIVTERGIQSGWLNIRTVLMVIAATVFAHILHPIIMIRALTSTSIEWRGIRYLIEGPGRIRMLQYKPYTEIQQDSNGQHSI